MVVKYPWREQGEIPLKTTQAGVAPAPTKQELLTAVTPFPQLLGTQKETPLPKLQQIFPQVPTVAGKTTPLDTVSFPGAVGYGELATTELVPARVVAETLGKSLLQLPTQTAASVLQAAQGQGGASVVNRDWADRFIAEANEDMDKFVRDIVRQYPDSRLLLELAQTSRNLGYSVTSMGAGLAVGVPMALIPLPGARVAAWTAGTVASGAVAYQMTTYQIMQEYLEAKNDEKMAQAGRGLTLEEENKLKADFHSNAVKYGLWEAVPEAISNLLFAQILGGPLGKMVTGPIVTRILTKMAMMYGEELLTETITQKGQSAIEVEAGLREKRIGWVEAFKEVAPQTFLLTTIMGGAGQVIVGSPKVIKKITNSLKKEIGETHPLYEEIKEGIETKTLEIETTAAAEWDTTTEADYMPAPVQQEFLARAETWLQQVPNVQPNTLHTVGVVDGEAFVRTDAAGNVEVAGISLMREGKLTLSEVVAARPGGLGESEVRQDILNYIKENNIALPPIGEMSKAARGLLDKLVARGEIPEYAPSTAMAEGETVTGEPGVPPEVAVPVAPEPIDLAIGRLTDAIRTAGPARAETELLKTAELGQRVPKMREAALAAKAEEAGFAAMGQLKGELPTAQFVPPTTVLTEGDVRGLYEHVRERVLRTKGDAFKWLHTDAALRKLLAGNIPTRSELTLLEDVFGPELIETILAKRPLSEKILENVLDVLNIPRAVLASFDFSAWLRQGAFVTTAYPNIGARALAIDLKTFFSGKYTAEIDQFIRNGKYAPLREKARLYLAPTTGTAAAKLSQLEESFMSHLVKKIPIIGVGVKWSERAYTSTLNYMRAMTFDRYAAMWEGQNYPIETYKQLATLINWATGRGPIGKAASLTPALNAIFFSTRLQTSRAAMLFGGAKFTSPSVRKAYARMMLAFFGTMGSIVALGALAGLWATEKDPRSSDFGKIRIGNTRLDPWAGFQPIARLIAQIITGERKTATGRVQDIARMETMERFFRSKASPVFGLAWDIIEGETFIGEALSLEAEGVGEQVYQRLTPLFIQDLIDAIKEEGWIGGFIAIPAAFGVGAVTYPGSLDAYERHIPEIPSDMLLDWQEAIQMGGGRLAYENLNVLQKAWLRRYCESIGDTPERKEVGTYNFYEAQSKTYEEFEVLLNEELRDVVTAYQTGKISLSDYIEQSEYTRNKYFGQASRLWLDAMREKLDPLLHKNLERWHEEEIKPEDAAYEEYMTLRANPPRVGGVPDWDAWDKALSKFLDGQTEESKNYIEQRRIDWINNLPEDRQPIERLILDCESILDDYYAIESNKRMDYRDRHPEVDARLIILRGLKPRSGLEAARALLQKYGITSLYAKPEEGSRPWETPPEEPTASDKKEPVYPWRG